MIALAIFLVAAFLLLIPGCALLSGRGACLIFWYGRLSPAERQGWDEKALARSAGTLCVMLSGLIVAIAVLAYLGPDWAVTLSVAFIVAFAVAWVLHIMRSPRFRR